MAGFVIGQTPIGPQPFDWYHKTVLSQYANSPKLLSLIQSFSDCVDQTANFDAFWDLVWNVDTAIGYGLDVWGRIVVVDRSIQLVNDFFGFVQGDWSPFNVDRFYHGANLTHTYLMEDNMFRRVILAKALANICEGTIPAMNRVLQLMFPGRGNCYVTDPGDMTMTYTFEFPVTQVEFAILTQTSVFQVPAGVTRLFSFP